VSDAWNPAQYERFRRERAQPFFDLLALVEPRPEMRAVDLGCGTGDLTLQLHEQLGARETLGIDRSGVMLSKSPHAPGLHFMQADAATFAGGPFDLIFSNAALHWVPDHPTLLRRLRSQLAPHGQLAVQMPYADDDTPHVVARQVARLPEFRYALEGFERRAPLMEPPQYAGWLHELGFVRMHVRVQVYTHLLDDRAQVVEWVRGALLTDYQKRLSEPEFARFLEKYREALLPQLSDAQPYLYLQQRILFWGALP
jgi:trans-aconitate 2-methyltransferase